MKRHFDSIQTPPSPFRPDDQTLYRCYDLFLHWLRSSWHRVFWQGLRLSALSPAFPISRNQSCWRPTLWRRCYYLSGLSSRLQYSQTNFCLWQNTRGLCRWLRCSRSGLLCGTAIGRRCPIFAGGPDCPSKLSLWTWSRGLWLLVSQGRRRRRSSALWWRFSRQRHHLTPGF